MINNTGNQKMAVRAIVFCVLVAVSGCTFAQVNALPPTRHILVYGDATARALPDRFKITMDFNVVDMNPDTARRKMEAHVSSVLTALKSVGVSGHEIVATSLKVESKERYDDKIDEEVFLGTEVSRTLTARFADRAKLEAFLAEVKTSRELRISSVSTELSDEVALRAQLRGKAIDSSREKASTIAKAYGARLGAVYSVSDVAPQFQYGVREGQWPSMYQWNRGDGETTLDRIEVTGSRINRSEIESLQAGYVTFDDKIYAVFLLAD